MVDHDGYKDNEFFFTNLRFKNIKDLENVEYIEFVTDGGMMDRIYPCFFKQLQLFYKMDTIPFHLFKHGYIYAFYHRANIIIKLKDEKYKDIPLMVDKYRNYAFKSGMSLEFVMYQTQNIIVREDEIGSTKLNFNHTVYFLMANRKLKNIKLIIGNTEDDTEEFSLIQDENGVIKLINKFDYKDIVTYCINFSQLDVQRLEYECDDSEGLIIGCVNSHIFRKMSGMIGLAYSK
jgi:hypothetical protein